MSVTDMAKPYQRQNGREYKWLAVYTRLNHERSVEKSLQDQRIEAYVPTIKTLRSWSDRQKWIETPLFQSYVFVRISNMEYHRVLQVPSVLHYICFGGRAAVIPDQQIDMVKRILKESIECQMACHDIGPGDMVQITKGPLIGYQGEVVQSNGHHYVVLRIEQLSYSILVKIERSMFCRIGIFSQGKSLSH
jgi:transcription antitermination factor NusG